VSDDYINKALLEAAIALRKRLVNRRGPYRISNADLDKTIRSLKKATP